VLSINNHRLEYQKFPIISSKKHMSQESLVESLGLNLVMILLLILKLIVTCDTSPSGKKTHLAAKVVYAILC
jgi:hypothetical protein